MRTSSSLLMVTLFVASLLASAASAMSDDVKQLLIAADKLVGQGRSQYQEAVAKYTQALQFDPSNTRGLYSRAEVYSMMRQREKCLEDLDALLKIDPLHRQSLVLRVKLLSQVGELLAAADDQVKVVQHFKEKNQQKKMEEALGVLDRLRSYGTQWDHLQKELQRLASSSTSPSSSERGLDTEAAHARKRANERCVQLLLGIINEFAKDNVGLRIRRAECALASKDRVASSDELKFVVKREPQNLYAAALSAKAFRGLGATEQAKSELKRCLALDPEFGPCIKLHKTLRQHAKLVATIEENVKDKKWDVVLTGVDDVFELEEHDAPNSEQLWRWRCEAYAGLRDVEKGLQICETLLQLENGDSNPQMFDVYLIKADLYILNDDIPAAEVAVNKAGELQPNHEKVREYRQTLERLKRAAERKDYYKILGVDKKSGPNDIRRAYRKLTKQYHPDQLRSRELTEKQRADMDVLYRNINEAKEVLLDDEKRRRYDNGEDVTKPPEQQGGGSPFHGSPFHFNFGGGGGGGGGHHQQFHFNFG
ncbi:DNA-J chaperone, putative [Bodo saltans]|uniref:DNA-J chaperone, putative n=1 Tax=Bodo saltans TaxID=75058 RepID=A0A0S4JQ76_BODSA|nr:DNA-J chaperone, putative [Bodo saltans]|eukprot:CUG92395.1 DNA-J chaperone, putative [Bodo saltans]